MSLPYTSCLLPPPPPPRPNLPEWVFLHGQKCTAFARTAGGVFASPIVIMVPLLYQ